MAEYKYTLGIYSELADEYDLLVDSFKYLRLAHELGLDSGDAELNEHANLIVNVGRGYLQVNLKQCDKGFKSLSVKKLRVSTYVVIEVNILSDSTLSEDEYIQQLFMQTDEFGISGVFG